MRVKFHDCRILSAEHFNQISSATWTCSLEFEKKTLYLISNCHTDAVQSQIPYLLFEGLHFIINIAMRNRSELVEKRFINVANKIGRYLLSPAHAFVHY